VEKKRKGKKPLSLPDPVLDVNAITGDCFEVQTALIFLIHFTITAGKD
jgi:hypothetical protein